MENRKNTKNYIKYNIVYLEIYKVFKEMLQLPNK